MERVDKSTSLPCIPLALMQHIPMDKHQTPLLHRPHHKFLPFLTPLLLAVQFLEPRPASLHSHKPLLDGTPLMTPRRKAQTAIFLRAIFKRIPEPDSTGGVGVEERGVLVTRHRAANLGLFADHHALEDAGVAEAEGTSEGAVRARERHRTERRGEHV